MKITIEENKQKRTYPYLGKDGSGLIVAFTAPEKGVVIKGDEFHKTGRKVDSFNEDAFAPINSQPEPEPIPVEDRKYPYVGKDELGQSVLFTAPYIGMLIKKEGETSWPLGDYSSDWVESDFTPVPNISRIIIDLE